MQNDSENGIKSFYSYCTIFPKVVIYGAGDVGDMVAEFMEKEGISFESFCITEKPEKRFFRGHKIESISDVLDSDENTEMGIIVAVSQKNVEDILAFLEKREKKYFYSTDFLFQLFVRRCQEKASKVMTQDKYLFRISDVVFDRNKMYICCPASIGDTLYTAAFVKAYKEENSSVNKVCLVLKKGHRDLGGLFSSVDEVLVSDEIVDILDSYSLYTQTWRMNNYIYGHFKKSIHFEYDKEYDQPACRTILSRYRRLILCLSEKAELEEAAWNQQDCQTKKHKYDVVIMPYAKTARMLPMPFWERLVERLKQEGYSVFTNIGGEKEKPVNGTEPVQESLLDTALLCGSCKAVISLRSGLCDLLGFASAKLIVINTSEELYNEWNLQDVFSNKIIYNVNCFDNKSHKAVLEEIMRKIK